MPIDEGSEPDDPLDEVPDDARLKLVRRIAATDRDANREIYDALETE